MTKIVKLLSWIEKNCGSVCNYHYEFNYDLDLGKLITLKQLVENAIQEKKTNEERNILINESKELFKLMRQWEIDNGESFLDYYQDIPMSWILMWAKGRNLINESILEKWFTVLQENRYSAI